MYCSEIFDSDTAIYVHYPQDPRSPGLPAFDPSWSPGWLLPPPWWASCAAWRTQRWANRALQHNVATKSTPFQKKIKKKEEKRWGHPTLSMILPFSCVGEGSCSAICSTGSVRSLSPNTSLKMRAIWRCWSREQCSSMDRITGYLREGEASVDHQSVGYDGCFEWTNRLVVQRNQNVSAEFGVALTRTWRKRVRWWPWPRPQTWSGSSGSSRGRWSAPQVLPSSPLWSIYTHRGPTKGNY